MVVANMDRILAFCLGNRPLLGEILDYVQNKIDVLWRILVTMV
jgi:hypothetical protein